VVVRYRVQGYVPSPLIRCLRVIASALIAIFRLHGRSRWSNEFIQALDPSMTVAVPGLTTSINEQLWFRTGHGRLYWRVSESPSLEISTNNWISRMSSQDVLFDVGANIGMYTLMAAKYRHTRVVAFEPDLMNARMLYENVLRNDLGKYVTVLPIALHGQNGIEEFHLKTLSYGDALHNLGGPSHYVQSPSGIVASVAAFRLDDLIDVLSLPCPTHLKIDVDGNEFQVLFGARKLLKAIKEILLEVDLDAASALQIENFLIQHGFELSIEGEQQFDWNRCVERLYVRP